VYIIRSKRKERKKKKCCIWYVWP